MSFHSYHIIHKFLFEKEMNLIYFSMFLMTLAESLIEIFVPIYLFNLGYEIYWIISFYLLVSLSFILFSVFGAKIVSKLGVKHSILISTPFLLLYYLGLINMASSKFFFFIIPSFLAIRMIFYNYGFHLNFIKHSDKNNRGKEISNLGIITILATILSPLIGGIIITNLGFSVLFIIGSILLIIGGVILFLSKETYEKTDINIKETFNYIKNRKNWSNILSFSGYAIESIIGRIIWPIFLIIILLTTNKVGGIVTLSMILSITVFYFIGKITDKYKKEKILKIATIFYFFGWIGRIFANSSFRILLIDSYKNVSGKMLQIPWSAKSYDLAEQENYFMFIIMREIIFNLSRIIVLPLIIILFYINFYPFIISFIIASIFTLFYPFLSKD